MAAAPAAAFGAALAMDADEPFGAPPSLAWLGEAFPSSASASGDAGLTIPAGIAGAAATAATNATDKALAGAVATGNALVRNGTAAVNHLPRRELPDREVFNVTALGTGFASAAAAGASALAATEGALATQALTAKQTETGALQTRSDEAAEALAAQAQALASATAADAPLALQATASEVQRFADGITIDPSPAQAPLDAALADAQDWAGAANAQAAAHLDRVSADVAGTAAQELAMQGIVAAEAAAAGATAEGAGAAAQAWGAASAALAVESAEDALAGLAGGALVVPFSAVEESSATGAALLAGIAFAARDGGIDALEGSAPARSRAASAMGTAANVTLASGQAVETGGLAARGLLAAACADPFAQPAPGACGDASLARGAEAVLQAAQDMATVSAGQARARLATTFDATVVGAIVTVNEGSRSVLAASSRATTEAGRSVVVPVAEGEAVGHGALGYAAAAEARAAALGPGLASDLSAEPGEALLRTVALAGAVGQAAGEGALATEGAVSAVVGAALR